MATMLRDAKPRRIGSVQQSYSLSNLASILESAESAPYSNGGWGAAASRAARHFINWNYVSGRIVVEAMAKQFPNVSIPSYATGGQKTFNITGRNREVLRTQGYIRPGIDDYTPVPDSHPLLQLMRHVNREDTWSDFVEEATLFHIVTGVAAIWTMRDEIGQISEMVVLPTQFTQPVYDNRGRLTKYLYYPESGASPEEIRREDMIIWKQKNVHSKQRPCSTILSAPLWSENAEALEECRNSALKHGINPDAIVTLDPAMYQGTFDESKVSKIREQMQKLFGGSKERGGVLPAPPGAKVQPWSHSPKEMDFPVGAEQLRDAQLALDRVPKIAAGIVNDVNRATVEGAQDVLCTFRISPLQNSFAATLTEKLASQFNPQGIVVWYEDCAPPNRELGLRADQSLFDRGGLTPDELRQRWGLPPLDTPQSRKTYILGAYVPTEMAGQRQANQDATKSLDSIAKNDQDSPE